MEWPGDFPEDHSFVELLVPGFSSELDFEQLLKDTEEKLNLNANRSVKVEKSINLKCPFLFEFDISPNPFDSIFKRIEMKYRRTKSPRITRCRRDGKVWRDYFLVRPSISFCVSQVNDRKQSTI